MPIEISPAREDGEALVVVRDHGPGLSPDTAETVFERFWRSSALGGRNDDGAGLGLAIVAAHGGAVFSLRLPLA